MRKITVGAKEMPEQAITGARSKQQLEQLGASLELALWPFPLLYHWYCPRSIAVASAARNTRRDRSHVIIA